MTGTGSVWHSVEDATPSKFSVSERMNVRLIAHPDLPEGFSLYEVEGITAFPVFADMGHPTYKVSYLVASSPTDTASKLFEVQKHIPTYCFRVNQSIKDAVAEFQRCLGAQRK